MTLSPIPSNDNDTDTIKGTKRSFRHTFSSLKRLVGLEVEKLRISDRVSEEGNSRHSEKNSGHKFPADTSNSPDHSMLGLHSQNEMPLSKKSINLPVKSTHSFLLTQLQNSLLPLQNLNSLSTFGLSTFGLPDQGLQGPPFPYSSGLKGSPKKNPFTSSLSQSPIQNSLHVIKSGDDKADDSGGVDMTPNSTNPSVSIPKYGLRVGSGSNVSSDSEQSKSYNRYNFDDTIKQTKFQFGESYLNSPVYNDKFGFKYGDSVNRDDQYPTKKFDDRRHNFSSRSFATSRKNSFQEIHHGLEDTHDVVYPDSFTRSEDDPKHHVFGDSLDSGADQITHHRSMVFETNSLPRRSSVFFEDRSGRSDLRKQFHDSSRHGRSSSLHPEDMRRSYTEGSRDSSRNRQDFRLSVGDEHKKLDERLPRRPSGLLYSDDGPIPRRSSVLFDEIPSKRSSSQTRSTTQTKPSFHRNTSSQNQYKPMKSRTNSMVNLKSTFKLHPSEHDLLNPIDTLLNQSMDTQYVSSILNEELKIWDTSDTPDNMSIAETIESRHSEDYMTFEPINENATASPLLSLPLEILYRIIEIVYYDDQILSINSNLENFANTIPFLTRRLSQLSLCFLYKYTIFNRPHSFDKFLRNLTQHVFIGRYVEFMDFQQFTSIGLGRTGRMMQEIQMVTSETITEALSLTPNLIEFLASENIQDDMDVNVLDYLFNRLYKIQTIDFCGASSEKFVQAFKNLTIDNDIPARKNQYAPDSPTLSPVLSPVTSLTNQNIVPVTLQDGSIDERVTEPLLYEERISKTSSLNHLLKISFHDCTSLTADIFIKILPHLHNIRRLDLNHTYISSVVLNQYLPHTARLTHLSLSRTSKLTTKDLINFLTQHPAVANNTLLWLNIQIDSNVVSPLSDVYLNYTLKHLKTSKIQYLNLGGLPIRAISMKIIKQRFREIKSLSIAHAELTLEDLNEYVQSNENLRYLDLSGMKLTRFNIISFLKRNFHSNLEAIEFDYKILYEVTSDGEYLKSLPEQYSFLDTNHTPNVWKFYDNEGRRAWIYKLGEDDPSYKDIIHGTSNFNPLTTNLVYYDLETGSKITTKMNSPKFLIYASRKINCSVGYMNLRQCKTKKYLENGDEESIWPVEFSQRGIYNYYSLNVK